MTTYTLLPSYGCNIIRDSGFDSPEEARKLFRDVMVVFRIRLSQLENLSHTTTFEEEHALRFMLNTLIQTKQIISKDDEI